MIVYVADRAMNILGMATTENNRGAVIGEDAKIEDVETGVASFEMTVYNAGKTRAAAEAMYDVGNYLLRKDGPDEGMYTIIDTEADAAAGTVSMYAEDAGLDLLNAVAPAYTAEEAHNLAWYVERYIADTGFEIGKNTATMRTMQLAFDEQTVKARLDEIAERFDAEINYSFKIESMTVTHMYVNLYKKRGNNTGVQLLLDRDVSNIRVIKSIDKLATGLVVVGGTGDNSDIPINLDGYEYDDGDFYVSGKNLYSRKALKRWARFLPHEKKQAEGVSAHVMRTFRFDTVSQEQLCEEAVKELTSLCEPAVNYEVDIVRLPESVGIGDTLYIVDRKGGLYLQGRVLKLETRCSEGKRIATLGEFLIQGDGVAESIDDLSQQLRNIKKDQTKVIDNVIDKLIDEGKLGKKILKIAVEHCLAINRVIPPGETFADIQWTAWAESMPTFSTGKFYWLRIVTYYTDGTIEYGDPRFDLGGQASAEAIVAAQNADAAADAARRIANAAESTANTRRRVFNTQPVPPYDANDMWFDGAHGSVYLCTTPKDDTGTFNQADWTQYSTDVSEHFWVDQNGAHVAENSGDLTTGASQTIASSGTVMRQNGKLISSWTGTNAGNAAINFYDLSSATEQVADLIASYGRSGITQYINNVVAMALTASALSFYTPDSNHFLEAVFGSSGINLYVAGMLALELTSGNLVFYDSNGLTELAHFGPSSAQIGRDDAVHTILNAAGMRVYGGDGTVQLVHIGYGQGKDENGQTRLSPYFTLGIRTGNTVGNYSMVEGYQNSASAFCAHVEGKGNSANAPYSHVEGRDCVANASAAHAGGIGNTAGYEAQTVIGKYATVPAADDLFMVGNGSSSSRSNAMRLKDDGRAIFGGAVETGLRWETRSEMISAMSGLSLNKPYQFSAGSTWTDTAGAGTYEAFGTICKMSTTSWHLMFMANGIIYRSIFDNSTSTPTFSTTQIG